ncbi:PREDICTED: J domain-containing protein required for chloroplast accumulation response 1 isoform X2 [Lupinus angustifolius]|uniref:J domain-containing protein required for chloroplast accumulation response 1 isoform X2 n=1 Tax=Lupinus angustifolius TaxID=3871 RepID=UPI00092FCAE3|nr:PREDICTED: J domain-containing protein required for chloroplast accumulation response 1 isoform X2 [Lupinus angustifolius]
MKDQRTVKWQKSENVTKESTIYQHHHYYYYSRSLIFVASLILHALVIEMQSPTEKWDLDFSDVFGGPPRRSSVNSNSGEEGPSSTVVGDYFYDDIFGGDESPRKHSSSSSLPAMFSLPTKLTKGSDLPTFGSPTRTRSPLNNNINEAFGASDSHLSRNDSKQPYRKSLLSQEFSDMSISDISDKGSSNMKQDPSTPQLLANAGNGQFHFSIYKWASKGVPLVMPLRADRNSRTKDKLKFGRCSSAKEWIVTEITTEIDSPIAYNGSSLTINRKQDCSNGVDSHQIVEQIASDKAKSNTLSSLQTVNNALPDSPISGDATAESSTRSISDQQQDSNEMTRRERGEESKMKSKKKLSAILDVTVNPKNKKEQTTSLKSVEHSTATSQSSLSLGENMGKARVKGKVKEFVRIFNQESVTKPRVDSKSQLPDPTYKEQSASKTTSKEEAEHYKKENSTSELTNVSANNLSQQDDISEAAATPDISFTAIGDKDGSFDENFMIQVLSQDENEALQNQENEENQVIDKKIQQWSKGKEGNIRSLLSTLQYVLWPESGWKPVPLVDIIEGNAVKRSYQRALLCLHPDKLQQKGAASHQKYTAEKVFDILQEAWNQFNVLGAL